MARTAQRREPAETPEPQSRFKIGDKVDLTDDAKLTIHGPSVPCPPCKHAIVVGLYHSGIVQVRWEGGSVIPYHEDFLCHA